MAFVLVYLPSGAWPVVVETAATPAARTIGLSRRADVGGGMLFVFPADTTAPFTMADTWTSLDVAFLDATGRAVTIVPSVAAGRIAPVTSVRPYRYVLELPGGWLSARGYVPGDALFASWRA